VLASGIGHQTATKKLDRLYILGDLNWRVRPRAATFSVCAWGKVFFPEELTAARQAMLGLTNVKNDTISLVTNRGEM
jgi:hypothetical protein